MNIIVFKPKIDNRYSDTEIVSHSGAKVPCLVVDRAQEILKKVNMDTEVVAIDEVQFFDTFILRINSSVLPANIQPLITSNHPARYW